MYSHTDSLQVQQYNNFLKPDYNQSPSHSNKENSSLKVRKVPLGQPHQVQNSRHAETEPNDSQVIIDISQRIMNEILNNPAEGQNELETINRVIAENSQLIKEKIQLLLGDNNTSFKKHDQHINTLRKIDMWQERIQQLKKEQELVQEKLKCVQDAILQLESEEKEICQMQEELDKHQNSMYDYYENEFSQLKENYDNLSQEVDEAIDNKKDQKAYYSAILETKAMLKEDLNGKLLQRAELVAQKEEQEELIEHFQSQDQDFFNFIKKHADLLLNIDSAIRRMQEIEQELIELSQKSEYCKQQIGKHNQLKQLEAQLVHFINKNKSQKTKLISIQKSLNLTHPDTIFNEFCNKYNCDSAKIPNFMQNLRAQILRQSGNKWSNANEYFILLEQYLYSQLQNKQITYQVNEIKQRIQSDHQQMQDQICRNEYGISVLKKEQNDLVEKKSYYYKEIKIWEQQFEQSIIKETDHAFSHYVSQNYDQLQLIKQQYGEQEYEIMLGENKDQFQEIITEQQTQKYKSLLQLIQSFQYLERVIDLNISAVDERILPDLKNTLSNLEQLKRQITLQEQQEQLKIQKMTEVEASIHNLEQDFRNKIIDFTSRDEQLQMRLKDIMTERNKNAQQGDIFKQQLNQMQNENIEYENSIKDSEQQLNKEGFYQKSKLEQEIVELNAELMNQQQLKRKLEAALNISSQSRSFLQSPPNIPQSNVIFQIKNSIQSPNGSQILPVARRNSGNQIKESRSPLSKSVNGSQIVKLNSYKRAQHLDLPKQINGNTISSSSSTTPGKTSNNFQLSKINSQIKTKDNGYTFIEYFD